MQRLTGVKLVVFGLSISSSWGNGHATLWRGLSHGLARLGHDLTFFERDVPYYAAHRDLVSLGAHTLVLYDDWSAAASRAAAELASADAAMVTSYCPDARAACAVLDRHPGPLRVFYDLDTPITLARLAAGESVEYLPDGALASFDLVLSYTGGRALSALRTRLGARAVAPLYGSVDPDLHRPARPRPEYRCDLSYLATYAADRQPSVEALLLDPARRRPYARFLLGGSQYPDDFPWGENLFYVHHVPPDRHAAFYGSSRATLSITRGAMAAMGHCPSGRLFEAAACGTPIVTDWWDGLDEFFEPGHEVLVARSADDVVAAVDRSDHELQRLGAAARERALDCHSSVVRARELAALLAAPPRAQAIAEAS